jgi:hypothetical protein
MTAINPGVTGRASNDEELWPTRKVLARYNVCDRTLERWLIDPVMNFPRPMIINKRRYFRPAELFGWEIERATGQTA